MNRKRILQLLSVFVISILMFTACKKNIGAPEDNAAVFDPKDYGGGAEKTEKEKEYKIGFSVIDMENPYYITLESAAREVIEENGSRMITKNPGTDAKVQEEQIQEMLDKGIDAIILSPVDWEKITSSLEKLRTAGVKIINVDTQVKNMDYVDAYIGSDNYNAGVLCGQDLKERCPEGGKVAILECPTQNSINERITGFEETLATAVKGFEVVEREDTKGEFEKALEASERILKKHPDIVAIMCGNDQLAVGAKTAANIAGLGEIIIYGVDGSPDIKKELKKPETQIAGTAAQSPINMGKTAARTTLDILNGEYYEKEIYEEVFMIDKDNVDMYGVDGWQ